MITLVDENKNPVIAFETDRAYTVITFSGNDLEDKEYTVYEGGVIEGESENGLYTNILLYKKGNKLNARRVTQNDDRRPFDTKFDRPMKQEIDYRVLAIIAIIGIVCFTLALVLVINKRSNFLILILGILVGISATIVINTLGSENKNQMPDRGFENIPMQDMKK